MAVHTANNIAFMIWHMKCHLEWAKRRAWARERTTREKARTLHDATMLGLITKLDTPFITVHQERCAMVRNRNANCLRCAAACTSGCISFDGEQLSVQPERCIGCGTCATVCPTCALEAHHPNDAQLENQCLDALRETGNVCIACANALAHEDARNGETSAIRVECLGRIEESLLTALAAEGAREVTLVRHACETCEHANGWRTLQDVCKTEQTLLQAWNAHLDIRTERELPAWAREGAAGETRERWEREQEQSSPSAADEEPFATATAATQAPEYSKVMADGTLPHFLPDRRERLLDALASLGEPNDVALETRLWGRVTIDAEACTSCQMCATFCPTGAIAKFEDEDGTFGIEHYPGDCVKCRSCESICFGKALRIHDDIPAKDLLAGTVERVEMKPVAVKRSDAHTIWHLAQTFTNTSHIYER